MKPFYTLFTACFNYSDEYDCQNMMLLKSEHPASFYADRYDKYWSKITGREFSWGGNDSMTLDDFDRKGVDIVAISELEYETIHRHLGREFGTGFIDSIHDNIMYIAEKDNGNEETKSKGLA